MASTPQYQRGSGPDQMEQGKAKRLNDATKGAVNSKAQFALPGDSNSQPDPIQGDLTGLDNRVFAATDRPNEPVTTGASFGPGRSYSRFRGESDEDFMKRFSADIADAPNASDATRAFAARVARNI